MQQQEAYPNQESKISIQLGRKVERERMRIQEASRYNIWNIITSHPAIPGSSVTSSPWVKIGFTVIWKYGGSAKHTLKRPMNGQFRINFTPIKTCKGKRKA